MDRQTLVKEIRELINRYDNYVEAIKKDPVLRQLFPKLWKDLSDYFLEYGPTIDKEADRLGGANDALHEKEYAIQELECFKDIFRHLNKATRDERHDHHGLHGILSELIRLLKELIAIL